jgi:hypothetical protein
MWVWGLNQCTTTSGVSLPVTWEVGRHPKFGANKYGGSGMMVDLYTCIHSMCMFSNVVYMFEMDVGTII